MRFFAFKNHLCELIVVKIHFSEYNKGEEKIFNSICEKSSKIENVLRSGELMANTIGFFGTGNMGKAMIRGLVETKIYATENIWIYDVYQPAMEELKNELQVSAATNQKELIQNSQVIIFAVKPYVLPSLLAELKPILSTDKLIISIAAGVTLATLEEALSEEYKIIRSMPNTPALVGEGMAAFCKNKQVTEEETKQVEAIFNSFGKCEVVEEKLMSSVVALSGSGPAYVYIFIEALADAAVLEGMPRPQAYKFAAQTVLGSAQMVLETGKHPAELKDMVTSPAGTTIAAVKSLEDHQFRSGVINAVQAAAKRDREM